MRKQSEGWKQLEIKILIDGVELESVISHVKLTGKMRLQKVAFDIASRIGKSLSNNS